MVAVEDLKRLGVAPIKPRLPLQIHGLPGVLQDNHTVRGIRNVWIGVIDNYNLIFSFLEQYQNTDKKIYIVAYSDFWHIYV